MLKRSQKEEEKKENDMRVAFQLLRIINASKVDKRPGIIINLVLPYYSQVEP